MHSGVGEAGAVMVSTKGTGMSLLIMVAVLPVMAAAASYLAIALACWCELPQRAPLEIDRFAPRPGPAPASRTEKSP